jgi:acylphosphatase
VSEVVRKSGRVQGRVQGVGFRYFTQGTGNALDLTGWVRNTDDGGVEFAVQGPPMKVNEFLTRVRKGPTVGRVDTMFVEESTPIETETTFSIKYY